MRVSDLASRKSVFFGKGDAVASSLFNRAPGGEEIVFSPDGKLLAVNGQVARVWDIEAGDLVRTLQHRKAVGNLAFSPDGRRIASASTDGVKVWDVASPEALVLDVGPEGASGIIFSPDGRHVVGLNQYDPTVWIWDTATGRPSVTFTGHSMGITCTAYSRDGTRIASGSRDRTVRVWDPGNGNVIHTLTGYDEPVYNLVFGADGKLLFTDRGKVRDMETGRELQGFFEKLELDVRFDDLADASDDDTAHDTRSIPGRLVLWLGSADASDDDTAHDTADLLAWFWREYACFFERLELVDTANAELTFAIEDGGKRVVFRLEGKRLAITETGVKLSDAATGEEIIKVTDDSIFGAGEPEVPDSAPEEFIGGFGEASLSDAESFYWASATSPDGQRIATARSDGVKLLEPRTGQEILTFDDSAGAVDIEFSPDGKRIGAACVDGVRIWHAPLALEDELRATGETEGDPRN